MTGFAPRIVAGAAVIGLAVGLGGAGRAQLSAVEVIDGAPMITLLPRDAIPAIDRPTFVSAREGEAFMRPEERVLGISDGRTARAYSTWQLNHHEIVNDVLGEAPLAVTW
jgi:hypothetical protein